MLRNLAAVYNEMTRYDLRFVIKSFKKKSPLFLQCVARFIVSIKNSIGFFESEIMFIT